jgi:hypothetical protein
MDFIDSQGSAKSITPCRRKSPHKEAAVPIGDKPAL